MSGIDESELVWIVMFEEYNEDTYNFDVSYFGVFAKTKEEANRKGRCLVAWYQHHFGYDDFRFVKIINPRDCKGQGFSIGNDVVEERERFLLDKDYIFTNGVWVGPD